MIKQILIALSALPLLTSCLCSKQIDSSSVTDSPSKGIVHLAIWSNYINDDLLKKFESDTGYKVETSNYTSNEELLAKLQAGATGYDLIVPSDYMVTIMANSGLLLPIDLSKIPNAKNLDPQFLDQKFDPKNQHSLPYSWSVSGIAINTDLYKDKVNGWNDLFVNPKVKGQFSILDDARESIGAALKAQNQSLNSKDPEKIRQAKSLLIEAKNNAKAFTSEPMDQIIAGEFSLAHMYSSDALQAMKMTNGKIQFVMPKEGGTEGLDNLSLPKGAKNIDGAHALINFLYSPEVYAAIVQTRYIGPVLKGIKELLPAEIRSIPALFPSREILSKFEALEDLGEETNLYDQAWTEVKASSI